MMIFQLILRQNDEDEIKNLSMDDLTGVVEFLIYGKTQSSESEKLSTKRLPVEKLQTLVEDYVIYLKENCHPDSLSVLILFQRFEN